MAKRKSSTLVKKADGSQIYYIGKRGINVYPIASNGKFKIQVDNNGNITTYDKLLFGKDDVNDAIAKTVIYFYELLKNKK